MKILSAEILESVISECASRIPNKHEPDDCENCLLAKQLEKDERLERLFFAFLERIMLQINPIAALLAPEDMILPLTALFLFAFKVGKRQALQDQAELEKSIL